jgi:hypothetical protein
MSEHDKGYQGSAGTGRPMASGEPSTDRAERCAAPEGAAQGQPYPNPMPAQGWQGFNPGGPQPGMYGAGMAASHPGYGGMGAYPGQPPYGAHGMHHGIPPHPAAYGVPPGVDPYWAYQAQAQAGYAPPAYPYAGMAPPNAHWQGYGPGVEQHAGSGRMAGAARGAGMAELVDEIANGGNGLSSLGKMLDFDDSEFWKGALLGAAAVLLLTNDSVQGALFKTGAKTKAAVKTGVDRVKERVQQASEPSKQEAKDV